MFFRKIVRCRRVENNELCLYFVLLNELCFILLIFCLIIYLKILLIGIWKGMYVIKVSRIFCIGNYIMDLKRFVYFKM